MRQLAVAIAALRAVLDVEERRPAQPAPTWSGSRSSRDRRAGRADRAALRRALRADVRPGGDRRSPPRRRGRARLPPARARGAGSPREWRHAQRRRRGRRGAARRGLRRRAAARAAGELLARASPSSRRRSASRWSRDDPNDEKDVIVEIQGGTGGEEAGLWAGDLQRMLARYAERRGFAVEPIETGEGKYTFAIKGNGAYSVFKHEGGHAPRAARAGDREPGTHPHLDRDGRRAARDRGGRRPDRPGRPPDRRVPLERARGPVGQHDRLRGPRDAPAVGDRRLDAGREVAAAEPREGAARAARAALRARARRAAGGAGGGPPLAGRDRGARREDPHLQLPPAARQRPSRRRRRLQPRGGARRRASTSSPRRCRPRRSAGGSRSRRGT